MLSVLVHTFNEEKNIKNCLESVKWADEIVIIDMYSTDKTIAIARQYTSKVFFFNNVGYADPARQFGLTKATHDWVLVVDADEMIPAVLRDRLQELIAGDKHDIIQLPRKNYIFGHLMKGSGWGPTQDLQNRAFRKSVVHYEPLIHDFFRYSKAARWITLRDESMAIIHFNYESVEQFITKLNAYTSIEAGFIVAGKKRPIKGSFIRLLWSEFRARFFKEKGYRDGWIGLTLVVLMAYYKFVTQTKVKILQQNQIIPNNYQEIAREIIKDY